MTWRMLLVAAMLPLGCAEASAVCVVNSVTTVTPTSVNTGTYTFPTAPSDQSVTFSVTVNYTAALGDACRIAMSFRRSTLPASMLLSGGGATLNYTVTSAANGSGSVLLYTSGTPAAGNRIEAAFNSPILAVGASANLSLTAHFLMQPATPQRAGSYADATLSMDIYRVSAITGLTLLQSSAFPVSGTVAKVCTIGGVATPASDAATIPISATGAVNTTPITRAYANAACNTPSNLQLTSQSGAVVRSGTPPAGFANLINYSASAGFSGATATLDTSTAPGASGTESGAAVSTTGTMPTGSLTLSIVPKTSSLPLISGNYSDTLRITITPQ